MRFFNLHKPLVAIAMAMMLVSAPTVRAGEYAPRAVVELFTSQGCSSCPAADRILAQYAKSKDVLALSFHVDYWNYLGWKDTFSKADFTERQYRYAVSFQRRGVYTPQAVINGRQHAVGSKKHEIDALMAAFEKAGKGLSVPIRTVSQDGVLNIEATTGGRELTLWMVAFDRERDVTIERGENRGRTITYHNVVRDMSMLGMASAGAVKVSLPMDELKRIKTDAFALLLQSKTSAGTPGPIVGATVVDNSRTN